MKSIWISVSIGVVVLLVSLVQTYTQQSAHGEFKTTDEYIQWLSSEAVKDAQANYHIALDYKVDSIKTVEQILGKLNEAYVKSSASISVTELSASYGAYIGEVIRRTEPDVHWERDDPTIGEKVYPLRWGKGSVFPMAWCEKRIVNGDEDNVWMKYKIFKNEEHPKTP